MFRLLFSLARATRKCFVESPMQPSHIPSPSFDVLPGEAPLTTTLETRSGTITIIPADSQSSMDGAAANFTGSVRVDAHFQTPAPARVEGATVTFAPGARTAWHRHPLGQTLLVVAGTGFVQQWGEPVQIMRPGDLVWIPPNIKHWHGAAATSTMVHIAITEAMEGKAVDWMEGVSPEQYYEALEQ